MSPVAESPVFQALGSTYRRAKLGGLAVPFVASVTQSIELPNNLIAKGLTLRLTGNLVIATANAAAVFSEAPLDLIKQVTIIGDGRRLLVSRSFAELFRLAHYTYQKAGELTAPAVTVGTRAFAATVRISHEMLMCMDPSETLFDPRLFKKVELRILWGAATDIATAGGGGTIALTAVNLDVLSDQTSEGIEQILFDYTVSGDEATVAATSPALAFRLPQNGNLAGILLQTRRDAGGGLGPVPVDDIVNSITLKSDQTVIHVDAAAWKTLQAENVYDYNLDGGSAVGQPISGYVFIPIIEGGMISSMLNTNALNNLTMFLNVTKTSGTEVIRATYLFLEPKRSLAQAVAA